MEKISPKNIAWVGTRTPHFEAMIKFLKDVMGLKLISKTDDFADFNFPGGDKFEIFRDDSSFNPHFTTGPVTEFLVEDVGATQRAMEAMGIKFFGQPSSSGGYSWSHFTAPDGNIYGLASGNYSPVAESFESAKGDYLIATDKSKLDFQVIHSFLSASYWAPKRRMEIIIKSVEHSLCFGVYLLKQNDPATSPVSFKMNSALKQVGFARVITDFATFAYLADVFIIEEHRGKGLSKWLMESISHHPALQGFRRWVLATRDAHGLYEQFGYGPLLWPNRWMEKFDSSA